MGTTKAKIRSDEHPISRIFSTFVRWQGNINRYIPILKIFASLCSWADWFQSYQNNLCDWEPAHKELLPVTFATKGDSLSLLAATFSSGAEM